MKLRVIYFLIAMLIVASCSQYEKDDTPDLPQGYLKVPIRKTIKTESRFLDARQTGITVYKWKTNSLPISNPDSPQVVAGDTGTYTVIYNNGQDSSKVIVYPFPICFIPNSFCPNGRNNLWKIIFNGVSAINVKVFSQDNIKLFETANISQGWDGKYNGKPCSVGYYYFYLKYTSAIGKEYNKTGYFQLFD